MKSIILLSSLLLSFQAHAFLSPAEEKLILTELNDVCSDSWCESSVEFNFNKISCSAENQTCELIFTAQENIEENLPVVSKSCLLPEIPSQDEIFKIETQSKTGRESVYLKDAFVDKVDLCVKPLMQ